MNDCEQNLPYSVHQHQFGICGDCSTKSKLWWSHSPPCLSCTALERSDSTFLNMLASFLCSCSSSHLNYRGCPTNRTTSVRTQTSPEDPAKLFRLVVPQKWTELPVSAYSAAFQYKKKKMKWEITLQHFIFLWSENICNNKNNLFSPPSGVSACCLYGYKSLPSDLT